MECNLHHTQVTESRMGEISAIQVVIARASRIWPHLSGIMMTRMSQTLIDNPQGLSTEQMIGLLWGENALRSSELRAARHDCFMKALRRTRKKLSALKILIPCCARCRKFYISTESSPKIPRGFGGFDSIEVKRTLGVKRGRPIFKAPSEEEA